jgi:hypothetical protein
MTTQPSARASDHLDLRQGHMASVARHLLHYACGGPGPFRLSVPAELLGDGLWAAPASIKAAAPCRGPYSRTSGRTSKEERKRIR